ncbi:MAG: twin-arginine translocase TatA/TatE family subunit [Candidatus Marsarchaeota archaeon]|nr:twin-arginine translocase TatA/TatE family subunit [Candidatus Marsarchaeota archaeon]MCW6160984.1 twin-arginine translocase TatA/TatE family subunit [Candidatus Micrarchaeales archaeon]
MIGNITDWVVLALVAIILFGGSKKIPELARSLGRAMGEFKKGQKEIEKEIASETKLEAEAAKVPEQ